jgi:hypothetical protein
VTQYGIRLLKELPEHRASIIAYSARRLNGEPDLRTKSGKAAARQVAIIERALRLRLWKTRPNTGRLKMLLEMATDGG